MDNIEQSQLEICQKFDAVCVPLDYRSKLGVSDDFCSGKMPINGLRHPPEGDTCGWYLWAGEKMSEEQDYFKPMHVIHLISKCPQVMPYLSLPVGWRFLFAGEYGDAWFDETLLEI